MPTTVTPHPQIRLDGQAAAAPGPLDLSGMYLMHHAFRRDLARLVVLAGAVRLDDPARLAGLQERLTYVLHVLHEHHTGEDLLIWPELRRLAPAERPLIDAMEAEHDGLDTAIEDVQAAVGALVGSPDEAGRVTAVAALRAVADAVSTHLAHEETEAIPVMQRAFTAGEFAAIEKQLQKGHGLRDLAQLAPWLADGVPTGTLVQAWANQPGLLLFLNRTFWQPRYARRTAPVWSAR